MVSPPFSCFMSWYQIKHSAEAFRLASWNNREIAEKGYDYWNNKSFIEELDTRSANYKSGKTKAIGWEYDTANVSPIRPNRDPGKSGIGK